MAKEDRGPSLIEYAVMTVGIAVVVVAIFLLLGSRPRPAGGEPPGRPPGADRR